MEPTKNVFKCTGREKIRWTNSECPSGCPHDYTKDREELPLSQMHFEDGLLETHEGQCLSCFANDASTRYRETSVCRPPSHYELSGELDAKKIPSMARRNAACRRRGKPAECVSCGRTFSPLLRHQKSFTYPDDLDLYITSLPNGARGKLLDYCPDCVRYVIGRVASRRVKVYDPNGVQEFVSHLWGGGQRLIRRYINDSFIRFGVKKVGEVGDYKPRKREYHHYTRPRRRVPRSPVRERRPQWRGFPPDLLNVLESLEEVRYFYTSRKNKGKQQSTDLLTKKAARILGSSKTFSPTTIHYLFDSLSKGMVEPGEEALNLFFYFRPGFFGDQFMDYLGGLMVKKCFEFAPHTDLMKAVFRFDRPDDIPDSLESIRYFLEQKDAFEHFPLIEKLRVSFRERAAESMTFDVLLNQVLLATMLRDPWRAASIVANGLVRINVLKVSERSDSEVSLKYYLADLANFVHTLASQTPGAVPAPEFNPAEMRLSSIDPYSLRNTPKRYTERERRVKKEPDHSAENPASST